MGTFDACALGDKVKRNDGQVGEIVAVTAKRFRTKFPWPEPQTIWRGDQAEQTTHFFGDFRKSDGRSVGGRICHWVQPT